MITGSRKISATEAIATSMTRLAIRSAALKGARWISTARMFCRADDEVTCKRSHAGVGQQSGRERENLYRFAHKFDSVGIGPWKRQCDLPAVVGTNEINHRTKNLLVVCLARSTVIVPAQRKSADRRRAEKEK